MDLTVNQWLAGFDSQMRSKEVLMRVYRTRGVQQPSKLKIAEFDSPYPLQVNAAIVYRLGRCPFKAERGVRFPLAVPSFVKYVSSRKHLGKAGQLELGKEMTVRGRIMVPFCLILL